MGLPKWCRGKRIWLPMQETWVWSLGQEYPLEEEMTTYSSIITWKVPRTEEPGRLQSIGLQRVRNDWAHKHTSVFNPKSQSREKYQSFKIGKYFRENLNFFILRIEKSEHQSMVCASFISKPFISGKHRAKLWGSVCLFVLAEGLGLRKGWETECS